LIQSKTPKRGYFTLAGCFSFAAVSTQKKQTMKKLSAIIAMFITVIMLQLPARKKTTNLP